MAPPGATIRNVRDWTARFRTAADRSTFSGIPTINLDYSPLWRIFPAKWTNAAIERGYRSRLTDAIEIANFQAKGLLTGLDGQELRPVGFIVNCPVVYRVN